MPTPAPSPTSPCWRRRAAPPWSGGGGAYAIPEVLDEVKRHKTTLIFHNTRAQAEIFFHNLWLAGTTRACPSAFTTEALAREQRERVEAAMVAGSLKAIVCTGSLDLGIDWGDVDLVIQVGAPKNVKRLVQRIGRGEHRYNAPSKALLVPANRFEIVECVAALDAASRGRSRRRGRGGRGRGTCSASTSMIAACAGPFEAARSSPRYAGGAYAGLSRDDFDDCLEMVATGGYALRAYDRWQRLKQGPDGLWQLRDPRAAQRIRMNIGTIQDTDTAEGALRNRMGGAPLGEVEEAFAATLTPGDTFLIGGRMVRYEGCGR